MAKCNASADCAFVRQGGLAALKERFFGVVEAVGGQLFGPFGLNACVSRKLPQALASALWKPRSEVMRAECRLGHVQRRRALATLPPSTLLTEYASFRVFNVSRSLKSGHNRWLCGNTKAVFV